MATTDFEGGARAPRARLRAVAAPTPRTATAAADRLEVVRDAADLRPGQAPALRRPVNWRPLRIAMIGQKGVPATFGGIEHHVEEVGARLAARGHEVTVYCRSTYGSGRDASDRDASDRDASDRDASRGIEEYRGMRLRHLRTVGTKHLDAIAHSALSTAAAMTEGADVVHYHALGPGLVAPLPRYLSRARVILTVHGLDNERAKWGRVARTVLGAAHWMSARVPDETVVVSQALAEHYADVGARRVTHVPNGVDPGELRGAEEITAQFGLGAGSYLLFVGRLVPEKAPDLLIRVFRKLSTDLRLVITGDSSFTDGYVAELRRLAEGDPRIVFTGYAYGSVLAELYSNAAAFILPSHLEGLPLTLLEAASYGAPVVASDIPPHLEVLGAEEPGRRLFAAGDERALGAAILRAIDDVTTERVGAARLRNDILSRYRWDDVTAQLEEIYLRAVDRPAGRGTSLGEVRQA